MMEKDPFADGPSGRGSNARLIAVTALTLSRAPLVLAFMAFAIADMLWEVNLGNVRAHVALRYANVALLAVSAVTDLFDGLLARRWRVTSTFGAICDPLMDKVFFVVVFPVVTAMLFFIGDMDLGALALAFTVLYILRDIWVVTLRALAVGKADMKANIIGKLRTASGFPIGVFAYCHVAFDGFGWTWSRPCLSAALILAFLLNIYSAIAYTRRYAFAIAEAIHSR